MNDRFDQPIWSGLERHLAQVEEVIPETPAWHTEGDPVGAAPTSLRLRPTVRVARLPHDRGSQRISIVLFIVIALALALVAGALLAGVGRQGPPLPSSVVPSSAPSQAFVRTGSMAFGREGHSATLLGNGLVLMTGGSTAVRSAELYYPVTGTFRPTGLMSPAADAGSALLLFDGRVLIVGKQNPAAQLYDPQAGTFQLIGSSLTSGWSHDATLLLDGRVLLAGGRGSDPLGDFETRAELYDPRTTGFSLTGSMTRPQPDATGTLLNDGNVLIIGTSNGDSFAELYTQPGHFGSTLGALNVARERQAAVRLKDGRVLVLGGAAPATSSALNSAEIYEPATGRFQLTGAMAVARVDPAAVLLPDGRVLVTGGGWSGPSGLSASTHSELYDPATGTFRLIPGSPTLPFLSSATLLGDGRVLIAGGWSDNFGPLLNTAYLFDERLLGTP